MSDLEQALARLSEVPEAVEKLLPTPPAEEAT